MDMTNGGPPEVDRVAWLEQEVAGLRRRLDSQPVIEQAKGLLIGYYGIEDERAFAVLRRWSQVTNTRLVMVATRLVVAASQPSDTPYGSVAAVLAELSAAGRCETVRDGLDGSAVVPTRPELGPTTPPHQAC